jgi:hypothetical protein
VFFFETFPVITWLKMVPRPKNGLERRVSTFGGLPDSNRTAFSI